MPAIGIELPRPDYVPFLGFQEEQYVPGHPARDPKATGWAPFYTCIANGKRVYVWAFAEKTCCVMVSDNICDPQRGADIYELQHMFADQHDRQKSRNVSRTHRLPCDAFVVQAFIHEVTRGGNEANDWIGERT